MTLTYCELEQVLPFPAQQRVVLVHRARLRHFSDSLCLRGCYPMPRLTCLHHPQGALRGKPALLGTFDQRTQAAQCRGAYGAGSDDPGPLVQHLLIERNLQYDNHRLCLSPLPWQQIFWICQIRNTTTRIRRFDCRSGWWWFFYGSNGGSGYDTRVRVPLTPMSGGTVTPVRGR